MRFFNTAGPVNCDDHYCLPPLARFDLEEILSLITQKKYFVLHAPRQTGKTSCLQALMHYINQQEIYTCLYINVESAQAARENVKEGMRAMLNRLAYSLLNAFGDDFILKRFPDILERSGEFQALQTALSQWTQHCSKPIVLLIDEVDALVGDTLISLLRQLRSGYTDRPAHFPQSVILCGVRDVRDYRIHSSRDKAIITGGSAFNIKAASLRLGNFSRQEMEQLYQCHSEETGQLFAPDALKLLWELSEGQPWLVNALAYEICFTLPSGKDRSAVITTELVEQAKEQILLRRETHLDQLVDKLQEKRVKRVIEPILAGADEPEDLDTDDIMYVRDLGLIAPTGKVRIANRMYLEVIPRELTYGTQATINDEPAWYINPENGSLDIDKLMTGFQRFFRRHSEHWVERFRYKEAGPQLLLQAFLQRIVNGGGRIHREYGFGRKRTDVLIVWPYQETVQEVVVELKIRYGKLDTTIREALKQTWEYMDKCGTSSGHIIIFDRSPTRSWDEKIFRREEFYQGHSITVWGM